MEASITFRAREGHRAERYVGGYGVRFDPATGLYYMRQRWYDPSLARFISRDPLRRPRQFARDGGQLYAYANNNPATFVDPSGLAPQALTQTQYDRIAAAIGLLTEIGGSSYQGIRRELLLALAAGQIRIDDPACKKAGEATGGGAAYTVPNQFIDLTTGLANTNDLLSLAGTLLHEGEHFEFGASESSAYITQLNFLNTAVGYFQGYNESAGASAAASAYSQAWQAFFAMGIYPAVRNDPATRQFFQTHPTSVAPALGQ